ncbi:CBS domain-containing protein [Pseudonocardia endophytica]|uniref:CBS domain-containing protein n=1 Tax=Pseudonocardia endophytica TaxID=401976 RepID=A0A4R1I715_PSEEN|nr:CBS domain-containing protein [Pseudonocardia endophytica]TCK25892.1 CBS domain-containing protein [Pseudonocardia endophytica]
MLSAAPASATAAPPAVADAMLRFPKTCGPRTSVADARALLADDHVHALLVVDGGVLLAVVEGADLAGAGDGAAAHAGRLDGRVVGPRDDLAAVHRRMADARIRRLAVVDDERRLLGLLCLKRSGRGFCDDDGVRARGELTRPSLTSSATLPRPPGA